MGLSRRLKDGKNIGELVCPPWCPSHGDIKVHMALKCVSSSLCQTGSNSTSLFGAAVGFPRAANSATGGDKMLQTASFVPNSPFPSLLLADYTSCVATPVS